MLATIVAAIAASVAIYYSHVAKDETSKQTSAMKSQTSAMESANELTQREIDAASSEASTALEAANRANEVAEKNRADQLAAYKARYAELVVISTQKVSKTNSDRLLTVRNLGYQRITKPQLTGKGATIIRLKNVQACSSATFRIDGAWYSSATELTFQDADGEWWWRAEGRPVTLVSDPTQAVEDRKRREQRKDWTRDAPVDAKTYKLNKDRSREKTATQKEVKGTDTSYDRDVITAVRQSYRGGESLSDRLL